MVWAADTNAYVCSTVLSKGVAAVETGDLSTNGYYTAAIPVVKLQIAKAGYRLVAVPQFLFFFIQELGFGEYNG